MEAKINSLGKLTLDKLTSFLSELRKVDKTWALELFQRDPHSAEKQFQTLFSKLEKFSTMRKLQHAEEIVSIDSAVFAELGEKASVVLSIYIHILKSLFQIEVTVTDDPLSAAVSRTKSHAVVRSLTLVSQHADRDDPWVTQQSATAAKNLLQQLQRHLAAGTVSGLLCAGNPLSAQPIIAQLLADVTPHVTREQWSVWPQRMSSLVYLVTSTRFPHLSDHLATFLPAVLLLLDDHCTRNQARGLRAAMHVLSNVSQAELIRYGRAEVLLHASLRLTQGTDLCVLDAVFPVLMHLLHLVDPVTHIRPVWGRWDDVMDQLLGDMLLESCYKKRRMYARHMSKFAALIGGDCAKHTRRLVDVVDNYLEFPSDRETLRHSLALTRAVTSSLAGNPREPVTSSLTGNPREPVTSSLAGNPREPVTSSLTGNPREPVTSSLAGNSREPVMPSGGISEASNATHTVRSSASENTQGAPDVTSPPAGIPQVTLCAFLKPVLRLLVDLRANQEDNDELIMQIHDILKSLHQSEARTEMDEVFKQLLGDDVTRPVFSDCIEN